MAYKNGAKLAVLGGGQLGRMLIQAGTDFNIYFKVLDPDFQAPCRDLAHEFVQGNLMDFDTVYQFGRDADLITIEIEHVNTSALDKLKSEGVSVHPDPEVIRLIQDKGQQKKFYETFGIPSAEFRLIENKDELAQHIDFIPAFQKLRTSGYDGRGVCSIREERDLEKALEGPSVLEKAVTIEKEISVICARRPSGQVVTFPVAELHFNAEYNLVDYLFSPASITADQSEKATKLAVQVAESMKVTGLLAVEMFIDRSGNILVNECAPRPHNSGHHTIRANYTSQFEQHIRAIFDLPLGSTQMKSPSVMLNLLGEKGYEGFAKYEGVEEALSMDGVSLHLYGKLNTRPSRKMGHITILGSTIEEAVNKSNQVRRTVRVIA